jgi:integrase
MQLAKDWVEPKRGAMTLGEFGDNVWLPLKRARVSANWYAQCEFHWLKYIKPALGDMRLRGLRPQHLRDFYASLDSPSTPERCHKQITNMLALAVDDGYIEVNVAGKRDVRPKRRAKKEKQAWSHDELRPFLASVTEDRLLALWRLGALTGLRREELCALHWSEVDLNAGTVTVSRTLVITVTRNLEWGISKTDAGRRAIAVDPQTIAVLKAHRKRQTAEQLASLGAWPQDGEEVGLVFTDEAGRALNPEWVSRRFDKLAAKVDVKRITIHELRHTHYTQLLVAGWPQFMVDKRLGHASAAAMANVYAHVPPDHERDLIAQFAALIDGSSRARRNARLK